jgi:hypothetical protein
MRAWVVGVENIRPHSYWDWSQQTRVQTTEARVVWQTERNHRFNLPPHQTNIVGEDELAIYLEFLRRCGLAGFELGEPP